ncbi:hypothetical protein BJY01DRAFT_111427 [Aspergillus pseudoustus]|uniref:Lysophospholipase A n=1 Tax=Aspergillus pseudoustus TaxID=1810923 RepID=A0ABR4ISI9_9EURO
MLSIYILALTIPLAAALPSNAATGHGFDWDSTRYVLAFGDSYTYVQGTHGHTNYSFIGDQLNLEFTASELLTDKIVLNQTGTSAGGPNWIEYLTGCGLKEGLTSPLSCKKQLWDFAFAGADISAELLPLHHDYTTSLVNQITQYLTHAHPVLAPRIVKPKNALVAVWIGINDINDSADNSTIASFPAFYDTLMSTLFDSFGTLHAAGYKEYLLLNLPPLDRTPANQDRQPGDRSPNATQIAWFNGALVDHAAGFKKRYRDTGVRVFDAHSVLSGVLDNPARYGIVNTSDFCLGYDQPDIADNYEAYGCPTPLSEYFWYNSGHITSRVHEVLAETLNGFLEGLRG